MRLRQGLKNIRIFMWVALLETATKHINITILKRTTLSIDQQYKT